MAHTARPPARTRPAQPHTAVLFMAVGEGTVFHREVVASTERQAHEALQAFLQTGETWLAARRTGPVAALEPLQPGPPLLLPAPSPPVCRAPKRDDDLPARLAASPEDAELVLRTMSREEKDHYAKQTPEAKTQLVERLVSLRRADCFSVPLRFRVLASELPLEIKRRIAQKLEKQQDTLASGDAIKYATWVEGLLALPLNAYITPSEEPRPELCRRLQDAAAHLDRVIYGHRAAKQAILERLFQWVSRPWVPQRPLGLQGCPGNGKSSLIREGLSAIMGRPYGFVALGGSLDSSYLLGHGYTYEGSVCGRIAETLTAAGCMNPLIFFDEVDKCSGTPKGEEIINVLVHLTDTTQSSHFRDRYFGPLDLDLSRSLLVFAFNSAAAVSPVLLDRLQVVATDDFDGPAQLKILKQYLLPRVLQEYGRPSDFLRVDGDALQEAVHVCREGGVRLLRSVLEQTACKVGIFHETGSDEFMSPLRPGDVVKVGPEAYELRGGLGRLLTEASAGKHEQRAAPPGMYA